MDQILFLLFCALNALIYVLVKYYHFKLALSTLEVISYMNIVSFIICMPYSVIRYRRIYKAFTKNLRMSILAPVSWLKIIAIQYISPKGAMIFTLMMPAFVTILACYVLKEYHKSYRSRYMMLLVSMIGVVIFIGTDIYGAFWYYILLLGYVLGKSFISVFIKQLSMDRTSVFFYSQLYFAIFSVFALLYCGKINYSILFNYQIWLFAIASIVCQMAMIQAYKITARISLLQNLDYSKPVFSCIFSYFLLDDQMTLHQYIGLGIIVISMVASQYKIKKVDTCINS